MQDLLKQNYSYASSYVYAVLMRVSVLADT